MGINWWVLFFNREKKTILSDIGEVTLDGKIIRSPSTMFYCCQTITYRNNT